VATREDPTWHPSTEGPRSPSGCAGFADDPNLPRDDATVSTVSKSEVPQRWWFLGSSGSGKTTYAAALARVLKVPHVELDSLFHQPGWTPLPTEVFRERVDEATSGPGWTIDGNYSQLRDLLFLRSDVIVAFDLPRSQVMRQLIPRTLRRGITGTELWNGNREQLRNVVRWDPAQSVIRWSWTRHEMMAERIDWYERIAAQRGTTFVRVRSHDDARAALRDLTGRDVFVG